MRQKITSCIRAGSRGSSRYMSHRVLRNRGVACIPTGSPSTTGIRTKPSPGSVLSATRNHRGTSARKGGFDNGVLELQSKSTTKFLLQF